MSALGHKQTFRSANVMSALCQKRTHAPQQTSGGVCVPKTSSALISEGIA